MFTIFNPHDLVGKYLKNIVKLSKRSSLSSDCDTLFQLRPSPARAVEYFKGSSKMIDMQLKNRYESAPTKNIESC